MDGAHHGFLWRAGVTLSGLFCRCLNCRCIISLVRLSLLRVVGGDGTTGSLMRTIIGREANGFLRQLL